MRLFPELARSRCRGGARAAVAADVRAAGHEATDGRFVSITETISKAAETLKSSRSRREHLESARRARRAGHLGRLWSSAPASWPSTRRRSGPPGSAPLQARPRPSTFAAVRGVFRALVRHGVNLVCSCDDQTVGDLASGRVEPDRGTSVHSSAGTQLDAGRPTTCSRASRHRAELNRAQLPTPRAGALRRPAELDIDADAEFGRCCRRGRQTAATTTTLLCREVAGRCQR